MEYLSMDAPVEIKEKFDRVTQDVDEILRIAHQHFKTDIDGQISFSFTISAPRDVLTDFERAQSVNFVTRFDSLPVFQEIKIREENGKYFLNNLDEIRHVLNEYRSIIQNKKDSIHFQQIHKFCREKLLNNDHAKDLSITVNHATRGDVTHEFAQVLDEHYKVIKSIIKHCEFGYIYNGILQHSDHRHTKRFWEEYVSGEINYVFAKHALLASNIKILLSWHYKLYSVLTFPRLGGL